MILSIFRVAIAYALLAAVYASATQKCRALPGDNAWPTESEWDKLNQTVGGRLVSTIPLGQPCHDPHYDEVACNTLKEQWKFPPVQ
jgi:hypothetical protein